METIQKTKQIQKQIPEHYKPSLDYFETQKAIKLVKEIFEKKLSQKLKLIRVECPRFLLTGTGLQDDLAGTQEAVKFKTKIRAEELEIPHSLAKWKRQTLGKHSFTIGTGLITIMEAIRKDETISPIHSAYVDQWDWEKVIIKEQRTLKYLKEAVEQIYSAIKETSIEIEKKFPLLHQELPKKIKFIHSEELEEMFPHLETKEREKEIAKKHGAVFIIGIGHPLKSGKPHDCRATDYDDWISETEGGKKGLDGDIIVWDSVRQDALELSSMGIRVDREALIKQLKMMREERKKELDFHKSILHEKLPLSIGGGIGRSRLTMFLLQKAHIGEVQSSVWPEHVEKECFERKVILL